MGIVFGNKLSLIFISNPCGFGTKKLHKVQFIL